MWTASTVTLINLMRSSGLGGPFLVAEEAKELALCPTLGILDLGRGGTSVKVM
jgi:hypothetical protein